MPNIESYTYLLLNLFFIGIPIFLVTRKYYKKLIKQGKLFFLTLVFAVIGYFVVDPLATSWGAWNYHFEKTLGILIGTSVIETLMWAVAIAVLFTILVSVLAEKEEKKKPFWPFL